MGMAFNILSRGVPGRLRRQLADRIAERIRVAHDTFLIVRKGQVVYEARISDITNHGFMVQADGDIQPRDLIEIKLPVAGWVAAQVRWAAAEDGRLGCKFLDPMAPEDFDSCLSQILR